MTDDDIPTGLPLEERCLTLEELARLAGVSAQWVAACIEEGFVEAGGATPGEWRFSSLTLRRVRRIRWLERDFDAAPELAALVADLLEELDRQRA